MTKNDSKKIKIAILSSVLLIIFFSYLFKIDFNLEYEEYYGILEHHTEPELKGAGYWEIGPIEIDNSDPTKNWLITETTYDWCSGSGTLNDPYTIENVTIDGMGVSDCILIQNSNAYFVIKNCTIFNGNFYGIRLLSVNNGKIINNDCSNNEQYGIALFESDNNYILDNIANNHQLTSVSDMSGIYLREGSDNNEIKRNIVNNNDIGIKLQSVDIDINNNIIQNNTANNNRVDGILVYAPYRDGGCNYNQLLENRANNNERNGIYLWARAWTPSRTGTCNYNEIWKNTAKNNGNHGISLHHDYGTGSCRANNVTENNVYNNTQNGIALEGWTNNNKIFHNNITLNNLYGLLIDSNSHSNVIYINNFSSNIINAYDAGSENLWDYGRVGNFWDDYIGIDADNNSIGDVPYDIPGPAQSKDHYPVVGSFDSVVFYFPSVDPYPIENVIISMIIAFGVVGLLGIVYGNRQFSWLKNFKRKRLEEVKLKEQRVENFQDLLIKSKELNEKANLQYSKGSFSKAINTWKELIKNYELALKKIPTNQQEEKIREALKVIKYNMYKVYIQIGEQHLIIAKDLQQKGKLVQAEEDWKVAKSNLLTAIELITSEKLAIDYKKVNVTLKTIETQLKQIEIEKLITEADATLTKAKMMQEKDLSGAIKTVVDSISLFFEVKKATEKNGQKELEELLKKTQIRIKKASNFQSELQDKLVKLIEITPILEVPTTEDVIEVKNYECPFCGELLPKELIQENAKNQSIECKYCRVNIPKKELK